jgi:glucan biosynthesis protein C
LLKICCLRPGAEWIIAMPKTANEHLYFMDAARGILMMLGIVLHTSYIYRSQPVWLIHDPSGGPIFDVIGGVIHIFRMPAFFIISGFFCGLTLSRYGPGEFYRRRLVRIGVPLLFVGLVLNTAQALLVGGKAGDPLSLAYWQQGAWVSHLWFLVDLLVYFSLAALLAAWPTARQVLHKAVDPLTRHAHSMVLLTLLWLPLIDIMLLEDAKLLPFLYTPVFGLFSMFSLADNGLFFVFGALLCARRDLFESFSAPPRWFLLLLVPAAAGSLVFADSQHILAKALCAYAESVTIWLACSLVLHIFRRYFSRPSDRFIGLADASYSIYLLHQLLVVALGMVLVNVAAPASIKFTLVVAVTLALTYGAHRLLIIRFRLLHFLLNGVLRPKPGVDRYPPPGLPNHQTTPS